jgi:hypothetical protein
VASIVAAALAGVLLLAVSGAITALGDALFPSRRWRESALTHSDSAHLFVRLRICTRCWRS